MKSTVMLWSYVLAFISLSTSCATIIHGSRQTVSISSYPSNATVYIDNLHLGTTPLTTKLKRRRHHTVKIELHGYMPFETTFTRKVDGWIAGNIIFGGVIGLAVDAISGGMYKLTPDQIHAELRHNLVTEDLKNEMIFVTVVLSSKSDWLKIGQMEPLEE